MRAPTHYLVGFSFGLMMQVPFKILAPLALITLIPDIDTTESTLGKLLKPISRLFEKVGHRTITHSLYACLSAAFLTVPATYFNPLFPFWVFMIYFSHPFADFFNIMGVQFLAPFSDIVFVSSYSEKRRMAVGSKKEYLLMILLFALNTFALSQNIQLKEEIIRISGFMYKSYAHAYDSYKKNSRFLNIATVTFYSEKIKNKRKISSPVIAMNSNALILIDEKGERIRITRMDIGDDDISITNTQYPINEKELNGMDVKEIEKYPQAYIVGEIMIKNMDFPIVSNDYITVSKDSAGTKISLNYGNITDIAPILNITKEIEIQLNDLEKNSPENQIQNLTKEKKILEEKITEIQEEGQVYEKYQTIVDLDARLKNISQRIENLKLFLLTNANKIQTEISKLKNVSITYNLKLYWFSKETK